jgi:hypothetical protein
VGWHITAAPTQLFWLFRVGNFIAGYITEHSCRETREMYLSLVLRLSALTVFFMGASVTLASQMGPRNQHVQATTNDPSGGYAIFSSKMIAKLPSLRSTPLGSSTIKKADSFLSTVPKPMPHLHVRHLNESQEFHDQSNLAQQDWEAMMYLGLAYRTQRREAILGCGRSVFPGLG